MMEIGDYGLETTLPNGQPADLRAEVDASGGLTLWAGGEAFPLGTRIGPPNVSGRPEIPVAPEPGDEVHFTVARSLLSWPTPFAVNFMTGHSPSWRRNLYYRLTWRKPSGLALDVVWRYEQWFYPVDGWGGGYMTQEGTTGLVDLRIVAAVGPESSAAYLTRTKAWARGDHRLERRGVSAAGRATRRCVPSIVSTNPARSPGAVVRSTSTPLPFQSTGEGKFSEIQTFASSSVSSSSSSPSAISAVIQPSIAPVESARMAMRPTPSMSKGGDVLAMA
jgi:hypothetical protein